MSGASLEQVAIMACSLGTGALILMAIYNYFFHPLARVLGPWTGAIFPFWSMRTLYLRRLNPDMAELHRKYGPVTRVGPNQLSFTTVAAHKMIYTSKPIHNGSNNLFEREGTLEDVLLSLLLEAPHIGSLSNQEEHRKMRRRLQPGFTSNALFEQEALLRMHVERLMLTFARNPGVSNLTEAFAKFLWAFVSDLSFGEPLNPEKKDTLQSMVELYHSCFPLLEAINYVLPQFQQVFRLIFHMIPSANLRAVLPSVTLRDCINRQDGRSDLITHIMGHKCRNPTELELRHGELHRDATFIMLAAYNLTETTLSALFNRLLSTPGVLRRLKSELYRNFHTIDEITGKKLLSLPYLDGCVYETLRLTPAVAGKVLSRRSPGVMMEGIYVPAGTEVYTDTYTMQRSPQYWHAPDEFRPERWFERSEGSPYARDVHEAFKPFSSGPRACLGKGLALQILRLTAALIVYRFDLSMADADGFVWEEDIESSISYSKYQVKATVQERG